MERQRFLVDNLKQTIDMYMDNIEQGRKEQQSVDRTLARPTYKCDICKDAGWVSRATPLRRGSHYDFSIIRCQCKAEDDRERRRQYLRNMDGLTDRERQMRFAMLHDNYAPGVLTSIKQRVDSVRGLITLVGGYGVGKTTLLVCAVNEGRQNGKLAVYTTLTDLLSYLRSTFGGDNEDSFDKYWDALIHCDILALDELDEPKATDWVLEKFMRLIDERWRRMDDVLTLCAINNRVQSLPGKIQSRLRDGRAEIIVIEGGDMRPLTTWNS